MNINIELSTRLQEYIKEFSEDVKLNLQNLKDKSLMISSIRAKWIRYYFVEKTLLDKLKNAKIDYSKQLAKSVSTTTAFPSVAPSQDAGLIKLLGEIRNSENCIEYIDKAFNVLDTFNFQIKNSIDILKLEQQ